MSREQLTAESVPTASGMPVLGLGTWQNTDPGQCAESVRTVLEAGYRNVDTAQAYENEESVGEGIRTASVDREQVFLATKVWYEQLAHDDVIESTRASLDRLGVDSVDLLYPHWPSGSYDPEETMSAFDALRDDGLIDHIGLSNFTPEHIDEAQSVSEAPIFAVQVEFDILPALKGRGFPALRIGHADHPRERYSPMRGYSGSYAPRWDCRESMVSPTSNGRPT